jgi:hypothetical protein
MKGPTFFDNVSAINCDNLAVRETVTNHFKRSHIVFWLTIGRNEDGSVQHDEV